MSSSSRRLTSFVSLAALLGLAGLVGVSRLAVADDPPKGDPGMGDPGMADPGMADPGMADPGMADPAVVPPGGDVKKPEPVPKTKAINELALLGGHLKDRKADNGDILASLDSVANAYHNFAPDDEAGQATLDADRLAFQKQAEKLFLEAYKLKRVNAKAKANERDDVNIRAVQHLGTFRPEVTKEITTILEGVIFKVKDDEYRVPQTLIDESFKAVGSLGNKRDGLPWLMGWIKYDNTEGAPEKIKAAYDAMVLMKVLEVRGQDRNQIVKDTIRVFIGVEHSASINNDKNQKAQKIVWDKVKGAVIKALQYFSQEPKDEKGAQFGTVELFDKWFREHDKMSDPIWHDEKPKKGP